MKRKTFDNYDYEEAFPVELDRDIQKKARKNFEKEHPLQVPDYEEQWKEQQEKLKEWELERLLKEGKVESLYRTTTTKAKNLQSGSELLEAQIYPSFCHKADVPHTKKGRESKPSQKIKALFYTPCKYKFRQKRSMVYVHMGQRTHSGRRSRGRSRYSELYSQDKLQTEKGRP